MAARSCRGRAKGKVVIRNIGMLLTGDVDRPLSDADTIVAIDGRIAGIGKNKDCDTERPDTSSTPRARAVSPGLIDSHVHPVFGDWTPRQNQLGWIDSFLHGGVTTMVSAGEVHLPGRPKDVVGVKALAITAQRSLLRLPAGRREGSWPALRCSKRAWSSRISRICAEAGVTLLGEVGLGSVKAGYEAKEMVAWARKHGIQSDHSHRRALHSGLRPHRQGHGARGRCRCHRPHQWRPYGSCPRAHVCELCEVSSRAIELVHNGNERIAIAALKTALATRNLHRVILGTDSPAGSGVQPLGILRMIALLSGLGGLGAGAGDRLRHRQYRQDPQARLRPHRRRASPAIWCSSTGRSIRPARTCSSRSRSATCRASAW